jgi:hypothetical protein
MKLVILQPGKLGDLIITMPVANFYKKLGYEVEWLVFSNFNSFFRAIDYVKPKSFSFGIRDKSYFRDNKRLVFNKGKNHAISHQFFNAAYNYISTSKPDKFLDVCWGFPGASISNLKLINEFHKQNRNWIDMRYFLCETPLIERWNFQWNRDEYKEDSLLDIIQCMAYEKYGSKEYSIYHNYKDNKRQIELKNQINFQYIQGYEIYDWYKVLLNSIEIGCGDSCLANFVEVCAELKNKKKYYLGNEEPHYFEYMRNIMLNNWIDINGSHITSDYNWIKCQ